MLAGQEEREVHRGDTETQRNRKDLCQLVLRFLHAFPPRLRVFAVNFFLPPPADCRPLCALRLLCLKEDAEAAPFTRALLALPPRLWVSAVNSSLRERAFVAD